jgi:Ricin-type beta-trefoil lectin domain-like
VVFGMAGTRGSGRRIKRRSRASVAMISTAAVVLAVLVAVGMVAFLHPWSTSVAQRSRAPLPGKVTGEQTVGLANLGPHGQAGSAGSAATLLYAMAGGLVFTPSSGGQNVPSSQQWQADQMSGGGLVLLFTPGGQCLTAVGSGAQATVALVRCDSGPHQRWDHPFMGTDTDGRDYWQLRSQANGLCLALGTAELDGVSVATMQRCSAQRPWEQLVMFWSAY